LGQLVRDRQSRDPTPEHRHRRTGPRRHERPRHGTLNAAALTAAVPAPRKNERRVRGRPALTTPVSLPVIPSLLLARPAPRC
jgi:hypothetical protein